MATIAYELDGDILRVEWEEIEALLGRPHEGEPSDDEAVVAALLESGAPEWVRDADGGSGPRQVSDGRCWGVRRREEA